jgi:hypothetical protein
MRLNGLKPEALNLYLTWRGNFMSYRTFVKLDPYERWILRVMEQAPKMVGKKRQPSSKVIGAIVREYFESLVREADPKMLKELLSLGPPCPTTLPPEINDIVNRKIPPTSV